MFHSLPRALLWSATLVAAASCQSAYYATMEKFGVHKREILVDRVEEARDSQAEAKEEFKDALTAFKSVQNFDGGKLEQVYEKLDGHYEDCSDRVDEVRSRIKKVESVSEALFKEWSGEIKQIQSPDLRGSSEQSLRETQLRYGELIAAMKKAESKMEPVLAAFKDRVLFLKHNLNAQAIASLQGSLTTIEGDVSKLIAEMEASIAEADSFVKDMEKSSS
jgi:ElaB/YqjD/DUF883 family membrane-anchored ribosome-binding protein